MNFPYRFSENGQTQNFMKIRTVEAELPKWADGEVYKTDGQTHMKRLIVTFRNFAVKEHKTVVS